MYGKIHEEIFHSSLMFNGGWKHVYVFSALCVLADQYGLITFDDRAIYRTIGMESDAGVSFDEFMEMMGELSAPDEQSKISDEGGRRIIPMSEYTDGKENRGYFIVNYEYYRGLCSKEDRQRQNREAKRRQREKEKGKPVSDDLSASVSNGHRKSAVSAHTDTDTDTDKKKIYKRKSNATPLPFDFKITPQMQTWFASQNLSLNIQTETEKFKNHALANDRRQVDWIAAWRLWMRKAQEYIKTDPKENGPTFEEEYQNQLKKGGPK